MQNMRTFLNFGYNYSVGLNIFRFFAIIRSENNSLGYLLRGIP